MKFLVISHTHSLLPFAYRLQLQGHEVKAIVVVQAFEAAWKGKMEPSPRDTKGRLDPEWIKEIIFAGDRYATVITDDWKIQQMFNGEGTLFGVHTQQHTVTGGLTSPIRLGGWFDGEDLECPHLLVVDRGAWTGGMGPAVDSGMTMIRIDVPETQMMVEGLAHQGGHLDELKSSGFRGLVQLSLNFQTKTGQPEVDGMSAGWPFLHTHAFVSELEDFAGLLEADTLSGSRQTPPPQASQIPSLTPTPALSGVSPPNTSDVLRGKHPDPKDTTLSLLSGTEYLLPKKFVTALPLSRPPWPTRKARFRFELAEVGGLTQEQLGRIFWHDVQVDSEAGTISTAGLDGLLGVARGAADTSELARARALEVAVRLQLPEKQFRPDVGTQVQTVLAELEQRFGVLL